VSRASHLLAQRKSYCCGHGVAQSAANRQDTREGITPVPAVCWEIVSIVSAVERGSVILQKNDLGGVIRDRATST
jgi:hypothetical protein